MGRAKKARSAKKSTVEELTRLLAQMRSGELEPDDVEFAKRCLAYYRARYLGGAISDRAARQLGLIGDEAQGQ